jgi:hypothetical protein
MGKKACPTFYETNHGRPNAWRPISGNGKRSRWI